MGAGESVVAIEYNTNSYNGQKVLKSISSPNCKDVLRLYRITPTEGVNDDFIEESLLFDQENGGEVHESYQVVLINQYELTRCFSLYRTETLEDGKNKLRSFATLLIPCVDIFESVHNPQSLLELIKLRKAYPNWPMRKVAEYLKLPEVEMLACCKTHAHALSRQESMQHEKTLELIKKEKPTFVSDFFGSAPMNYFFENHPEIVSNFFATIDSLRQTGKDFKGSIDNITKYTESPIHAAIRLSQDSVLKLLLEKGANPFIPCGHAYPIHLAMKHESKGCLKLLVEHDNKCAHVKDKKYAGSGLHWAKNTEQVDIFASKVKDFDINMRNSEDDTALHIMVKRQRLSPAISMICHGADISAKGKSGATPLHYAVQHVDLDVIKALLFLGADFTLKDDHGNTPLDYVKQGVENAHEIEDVFSLFSYDCQDIDRSSPPRTQSILKEKTGKEAILALDGGGIRGLCLTEVLIALESITKQPLHNLFDWISGTSTGSYLAASIANRRHIRHCQQSYLRLGRTCFVGVRPYPTENMDEFLIDEFGGETTIDQVTYPKLVIPAVLVDRRPAMLHLFRNYEAPYDHCYTMRDARFPRPPLASDQLLWLAIRSSCSAPSYFRSTGRYLDGGLIANNPTLDLISEVHKYSKYVAGEEKKEKVKMGVVMSVGTGRAPLEHLRPIDIYLPSSVWDTAEIVDNLKSFVDLMVDQVAASDNHVVDRARSWCEMADIEYYRYNPTLTSHVELNEIDDRVLLAMLCDVRKYIKTHFKEFEKLGKSLLGE